MRTPHLWSAMRPWALVGMRSPRDAHAVETLPVVLEDGNAWAVAVLWRHDARGASAAAVRAGLGDAAGRLRASVMGDGAPLSRGEQVDLVRGALRLAYRMTDLELDFHGVVMAGGDNGVLERCLAAVIDFEAVQDRICRDRYELRLQLREVGPWQTT